MCIRERYRPRAFNDLIFPSASVELELLYYAQTGLTSSPGNLLLHGPIGTAKTTVVSVLAHYLLGDTYTFNASVVSGSDITTSAQVRAAIAQTVSLVPVEHMFRIIVIDELCAVSREGQRQLRSMIDIHQDHCVFLLTANNIDVIDRGVISRCRTIRFGHAAPDRWLQRAKKIVAGERISLSDEVLMAAIEGAEGDVRRLIQNLQDLVNLTKAKSLIRP